MFLNDFKNQIQAHEFDAGVDRNDSRFIGNQRRNSDLGGQRRQIPRLDMRAAHIGQGQFNADDRLKIDQVAGRASGDVWRRIPVGAGEHEGGDALCIKALGFGIQAFHRAGERIGSQQPHRRCHTVCRIHAEPHFRRAGVKAPLAAAAREMLMPVNKARNRRQSFGIDDFNLAGQHAGLNAFFNGQYFPAARQYITSAHCAGRKDLCIFYQYHQIIS